LGIEARVNAGPVAERRERQGADEAGADAALPCPARRAAAAAVGRVTEQVDACSGALDEVRAGGVAAVDGPDVRVCVDVDLGVAVAIDLRVGIRVRVRVGIGVQVGIGVPIPAALAEDDPYGPRLARREVTVCGLLRHGLGPLRAGHDDAHRLRFVTPRPEEEGVGPGRLQTEIPPESFPALLALGLDLQPVDVAGNLVDGGRDLDEEPRLLGAAGDDQGGRSKRYDKPLPQVVSAEGHASMIAAAHARQEFRCRFGAGHPVDTVTPRGPKLR
jgi:hypothetical protein